jgi:hypothetical protein
MLSTTLLLAASMVVGQAEETKVMPVFAVHHFELKEGIEAEQFESFAAGEFAKAFAKPHHGLRAVILKGDRGALKGKYAMMIFFESKELRDKYFPVEGGGASDALRETATPSRTQAMEKLQTFVERKAYTDFISLGE